MIKPDVNYVGVYVLNSYWKTLGNKFEELWNSMGNTSIKYYCTDEVDSFNCENIEIWVDEAYANYNDKETSVYTNDVMTVWYFRMIIANDIWRQVKENYAK